MKTTAKEVFDLAKKQFPGSPLILSCKLYNTEAGDLVEFDLWIKSAREILKADSLEQLKALLLTPLPARKQEVERVAAEIDRIAADHPAAEANPAQV